MAQKKAKKTIKDPDMKPAEDPKGGGHHRPHGHGFSSLVNQKEDPRPAPGGGYGIHEVQ